MTKRDNPLALAVLVLLLERPMHPYEMVSTLRERDKADSIKLRYGSLYTVVRALARDGMIEATETVREGSRPERTVYALTEPGRRESVEWLRELLGDVEKEFPRFLAGLSLMPALPVDDVVRLLDARVGRLTEYLDAYRGRIAAADEQGIPEIFLVEDHYRVAIAEAELAWVGRLVASIRDGTLAGLQGWREFHDWRSTDGNEDT